MGLPFGFAGRRLRALRGERGLPFRCRHSKRRLEALGQRALFVLEGPGDMGRDGFELAAFLADGGVVFRLDDPLVRGAPGHQVPQPFGPGLFLGNRRWSDQASSPLRFVAVGVAAVPAGGVQHIAGLLDGVHRE
jgi:hypothetical protein